MHNTVTRQVRENDAALKVTTVNLQPDEWALFVQVMKSQGESGSAALRRLIRRELKKAGRA